jgi:hypothetical protein
MRARKFSRLSTPRPERTCFTLPVLNGRATYVDLTAKRNRSFKGRVLDAGSPALKGLANIQIRVVGYPAAVAVTDKNGQFTLTGIPGYGPYPIYLETTSAQEFKHRYRMGPSHESNLALFRFSGARLELFLRQLEGGVSPESGLVVAAFPKLAAQGEKLSLIPRLRPVLPGMPLPPETYTVGPDERLDEKAALSRRSSRSLSVQVPEGLNIAQVIKSSKKVLWSELIIASPGVVNVVGPY